jgi:biopolymer transport protein ExbD
MYPESTCCTPVNSEKQASMHQKHPAPKVAIEVVSFISICCVVLVFFGAVVRLWEQALNNPSAKIK